MRDRIALSQPVYHEIVAVMHREKLARFIQPALRERLLADLAVAAVWVRDVEDVRACRDPADDKVLALALAARAEIIVTSDADLLVLDAWRGARILRPGDYLRSIGL